MNSARHIAAAISVALHSGQPNDAAPERDDIMRGVTKHGRMWRVCTHVNGLEVRESFATEAQAADFLARVKRGTVKVDQLLRAADGITVAMGIVEYPGRGDYPIRAAECQSVLEHMAELEAGKP